MPPLKSTFYGGFDACPLNIEFPGDDRAIFRVGVSLQDFKHGQAGSKKHKCSRKC